MGIDHRSGQLDLKRLFLGRELSLEKPFPTIGRIADCCLEKERIIFEIQCSPISYKEAFQRVSDYGLLGYQVVWLLDDRLFNQKRLKEAEGFLRSFTSFFIRFQEKAAPLYYDQFETFSGKKRIYKGRPTQVFLEKICKMPKSLPKPSLRQVEDLKKNAYYFVGDRVHLALNGDLSYWKEREISCQRGGFFKVLGRGYFKLLDKLLEFTT